MYDMNLWLIWREIESFNRTIRFESFNRVIRFDDKGGVADDHRGRPAAGSIEV